MTLNLFKACIMSNHSRATKKNQITIILCDHGGQGNKKTSKKAPGNGIFSDFDHWRPYISIYIYIYKYIYYIYIYIIYIIYYYLKQHYTTFDKIFWSRSNFHFEDPIFRGAIHRTKKMKVAPWELNPS